MTRNSHKALKSVVNLRVNGLFEMPSYRLDLRSNSGEESGTTLYLYIVYNLERGFMRLSFLYPSVALKAIVKHTQLVAIKLQYYWLLHAKLAYLQVIVSETPALLLGLSVPLVQFSLIIPIHVEALLSIYRSLYLTPLSL